MPEARMREAAVDWITVTCHDPKRAGKLATFGYELVAAEVERENKPAIFDLYGYTGAHAGAVSYGTRPDGAILQISGAAAAESFLEAVRLGENVTRLDLQVTVRQTPFDPWLASTHYVNRPATVPGKGRTPMYRYYESSAGGSTLYVGSPSSEQMGRMYNKAAESLDPRYANCWRYEVQLRQRGAGSIASSLSREESQTRRVAGIVWWWFKERGVTPLFDQEAYNSVKLPPRPLTDAQRKLEWLAKAVRPTCDWLREIDRCEELMSALGFSGALDPLSVPGIIPETEDVPVKVEMGASNG